VQLLTNKSNEIHQISNDKIANPHQFGNETYNEIELGSSALRNTLPSNFVNSLLKNKFKKKKKKKIVEKKNDLSKKNNQNTEKK
jgi:hypothetical protein